MECVRDKDCPDDKECVGGVSAPIWATAQGPTAGWLWSCLNCAAIFYRDANRGDAVGYYQGLADALESAGVLSDDKWIMQWDGTRLAKDAKRPRIEVTLTALDGD